MQAYGPAAMEEAQRIYGARKDFLLCGTKEAALQDADALVIMTDWRQFKAPDFNALKQTLKSPLIIDGRNLYDPHKMHERGFRYHGSGR